MGSVRDFTDQESSWSQVKTETGQEQPGGIRDSWLAECKRRISDSVYSFPNLPLVKLACCLDQPYHVIHGPTEWHLGREPEVPSYLTQQESLICSLPSLESLCTQLVTAGSLLPDSYGAYAPIKCTS